MEKINKNYLYLGGLVVVLCVVAVVLVYSPFGGNMFATKTSSSASNTSTKSQFSNSVSSYTYSSYSNSSSISTNSTASTTNNSTNSSSSPKTSNSGGNYSMHSTRNDCWVKIGNNIYDITNFIDIHQGGDIISSMCGKDATEYDHPGGPLGSNKILSKIAKYKVN